MKKVKNISLILLVLALLLIGSSSIVVTNENEYSLIRQFGKVDHVVSSAGVTFKIPFVQSVDPELLHLQRREPSGHHRI